MIEVLLPVEVQRARYLARKGNGPEYLGPASSVVALAPPGAEMNPVNEVRVQVFESERSISDQVNQLGSAHSLLSVKSNSEISLMENPIAPIGANGNVETTCVSSQEDINEVWLNLYRKEFLKLVANAKRGSRLTKAIARLAYGFRKLDKRIKLSFRLLREIRGLSSSNLKRAALISSGTTDLKINMLIVKSAV